MKPLLYFENIQYIAKSGIGRARSHQMQALGRAGVEYTLDSDDSYDILHINTIYTKSPAMIRKARRKGAKVIYHAHSIKEDFENSFIGSNAIAPLYKRWLMYLYRKADAIITPTEYSKAMLESYGLQQPIYAISNGINTQDFCKDPEREAVFREYFGLKPEDNVVISTGLWIERKGILDFVAVAEKFPQTTFIWFGNTSKALITHKVRKILKHHPSNVIFPGYISGDVIKGAYSAANAFFFPSYAETEGIVVLEALASEQRVLLRDLPVFGWLQNEHDCLKAADHSGFEQRLQEILDGKWDGLSANARAVVEGKDIGIVGEQLRAAYEKTLAQESASVSEEKISAAQSE